MKRINPRMLLGAALFMGGATVAASALADPAPSANPPGPGYGAASGMMNPAFCPAMGSDMTGGFVARADLNLTAEQRRRIAKIEANLRHAHWDLMGKIQDQESQMNEQFNSEQRDDAALSKSFRNISDLRNQMFDLSLHAETEVDAVLTEEQRAKLRPD